MKTTKKVIGIALCALVAVSSLSFGASAKAKSYVKSIKVSKKAAMTIPANKSSVSKNFKVTVKVSGKASKKFTAKSSNKSVAAVKVSGKKIKVTAKKAGKATITLKTKAKGKKKKVLKAKLVITVKKASAKKVTPAPSVTPTEAATSTQATEPSESQTPTVEPTPAPTVNPTEAPASTQVTEPGESQTPTADPTQSTDPSESQAPTQATDASASTETTESKSDTVTFYYAPSKEQLDDNDTFKLNYRGADDNWTQIDMKLSQRKTEDGSPVYEAEVPADIAETIKAIQYQVYDETGKVWKSQVELNDVNLSELDGSIISSEGKPVQPATTPEPQPTETQADTITAPPTEETKATTAPTTSDDGWDPRIIQP